MNEVNPVTAVTRTGHTLRRESVFPVNTIRSLGTRPCATEVLIVHTFDATVIFPDIAIVDGVDSDSTVPLESTPITPKACSTPTRRCEIDTHASETKGILNFTFVVNDVSVPVLNGDCDTFMYRDPFVLPSTVTISPVPVDTSYISVMPITFQGTSDTLFTVFSITDPPTASMPFCDFIATVSLVTGSLASMDGTILSSNDAFFVAVFMSDIFRGD